MLASQKKNSNRSNKNRLKQLRRAKAEMQEPTKSEFKKISRVAILPMCPGSGKTGESAKKPVHKTSKKKASAIITKRALESQTSQASRTSLALISTNKIKRLGQKARM